MKSGSPHSAVPFGIGSHAPSQSSQPTPPSEAGESGPSVLLVSVVATSASARREGIPPRLVRFSFTPTRAVL